MTFRIAMDLQWRETEGTTKRYGDNVHSYFTILYVITGYRIRNIRVKMRSTLVETSKMSMQFICVIMLKIKSPLRTVLANRHSVKNNVKIGKKSN